MAKSSYDAVIIGAGIIGPSTAYHLAKNGLTNIAIIDAHKAGGQATRATAAMVMHQTGNKTTTKLSKLSIAKYANFLEEVGHDIKFKKAGSVLFTQTPTGLKKLEKQLGMQRELGIPTEAWEGKTINEASNSLISPQGVLYGVYCPADGYIDANLAVNGYLTIAKKLGADIIEDIRVSKVNLKNSKVESVELSDGQVIQTHIVINCAGAYANDIARTFGLTIPIKSSYKCLGVVGNIQQAEEFPIVEDIDQGWYFRPHSKGVLVGFGKGEYIEDEDREEFPVFDPAKETELRDYIKLRAPSLLSRPLVEKWAGYRPMIDPKFSDDLPIIGPAEGFTGYYNNCGYGEFGITHGAIGGELLADYITGKKTAFDIEPFLLSRFYKKQSSQ